MTATRKFDDCRALRGGRGAYLVVALAGACVSESRQPLPDTVSADSLRADSLRAVTDTVRAPGSADTAAALDSVSAAPRPRPPLASRPGSRPPLPAGPPNDSSAVALVVVGRAELAVDSTTFAPADYMKVILQGERRQIETITDRAGRFFFEQVPAGRYELRFVTATKLPREVYRLSVSVGAGGKVLLPPIHIPLDSLKRSGA